MSDWNSSKQQIKSLVNLKNKKLLDIGCGDGWLLSWCFNDIVSGLGIEPSIEQIKLAEKNIKNNKIIFKNIGAESIGQLNDTFDLIIFFNSFHHVPVDLMSHVLNETTKCMHKDSIIIIIEPLAEGNFYKFMRDIDDEYEVRLKAYKSIKNCKIHNLKLRDEIFYNEVKSFDNFEKCINFIKNVDVNRKPYINNNIDKIKSLFIDLSKFQNGKFEFKQPMRLNMLSLMKG